MAHLDAEPILAWPKVHTLTGLSRSTVNRLRSAGAFPEPIRLSPNRVGWRAGELTDWLSARAPVREG